MTSTDQQPEGDLNQIIVSAVNARVEAAVVQALAGDEVMGRYVTMALTRQVEVPSRTGSYGKDRVPWLSHIIEQAVRDAAKRAVERYLVDEHEALEDEVRKALRRTAPVIAEKMVGQISERASKGFGIQVSLRTGD